MTHASVIEAKIHNQNYTAAQLLRRGPRDGYGYGTSLAPQFEVSKVVTGESALSVLFGTTEQAGHNLR